MLEVELCNLRLKNPIILASGVLGSTSASLYRMAEDAGAVVTKSIGLKAREGYKNPTVINYAHGLINAVGLASPDAKTFAKELEKYVKISPLIVSLYAFSAEEFAELTKYFPMADAFELNLSCPHVKKAGLEIGSDAELVREVISLVKKNTDKPVFAKISAMVNVVEIGKAAEEAKVDAIVVTNTLKGMAIDIMSKKPILSNVSGGVSGEAIKPIALK